MNKNRFLSKFKKYIRVPASKRERVKLGVLASLGVGIVTTPLSLVVLAPSGTSPTGGLQFVAKANQKLAETTNEVTIVQGAKPQMGEGEHLIHMASPTQRIFSSISNKFSANPSGRVLNLEAGIYYIYVKYEGDSLKLAKLMRCVKTVKFETYCPTGNSIEARKDQHGLVDITDSLLTTYTGPPGLKNREIKGLYDKSFEGKFWEENASSKIAKLRLYTR